MESNLFGVVHVELCIEWLTGGRIMIEIIVGVDCVDGCTPVLQILLLAVALYTIDD
jgi:hypothetical protein